MMHGEFKFAGLLVELHRKIGSLFVQGVAPILPAAANPLGGDKFSQIHKELIRKILPEIIHSLSATLAFQEFEQLTICGNELRAGNHLALW